MLSAPGGKLVDATANLPQQYDFTHSASEGDIDNDGDLDLYIGNFGFRQPPQFWMNDGNGNFTVGEGRVPPFFWPDGGRKAHTWSKLLDVNNDGFLDLILGGFVDVDSEVLLNDGNGYFSVLPGALPA